MRKFILSILIWNTWCGVASAQSDTLRIMAYNVLYYGDRPACQGPHSVSHGYLKTIVQYAHPDVLGLEKMASIPMYAGDNSGSAPTGFADSVVQYALNAAYPGRYAHCMYTNTSGDDAMCVLFYNQQKLGFAGIAASYANVSDFNTYKLYYKAADLATTHDTTFLYVTLNHTVSGSGSSDEAARFAQIDGEMTQLQGKFSVLPNLINMGDFNLHSSTEDGYQRLVAPADPGFEMFDPPFVPDAAYSYPADWDSHPTSYAASLTTSTRQSGSVPNSCGTSGGGKSWYDHIFLSSAIVNNTAGIKYIPHSYTTIGNDGNRVGISINSAPANTSAPAAVIDALFQMSNKYPVMVDVEVNNPIPTSAAAMKTTSNIVIVNPVAERLVVQFGDVYKNCLIHVICMDMQGRIVLQRDCAGSGILSVPLTVPAGVYLVQCSADGKEIHRQVVTKK